MNVPTTTVDRLHETWAIAGVAVRVDNSHPVRYLLSDDNGRCHPFVFRIYHPPRAA
jgi:hypothetical protein